MKHVHHGAGVKCEACKLRDRRGASKRKRLTSRVCSIRITLTADELVALRDVLGVARRNGFAQSEKVVGLSRKAARCLEQIHRLGAV